jgi:hypothetical protein
MVVFVTDLCISLIVSYIQPRPLAHQPNMRQVAIDILCLFD